VSPAYEQRRTSSIAVLVSLEKHPIVVCTTHFEPWVGDVTDGDEGLVGSRGLRRSTEVGLSHMSTYLVVGGLVAVGFDEGEEHLLTVSHAGRGVFRTSDWARVARDPELAYPDGGVAVGIGPIEGVRVKVTELDSGHGVTVMSPSGRFVLQCASDGIRVKQP
jgi:hypothetical protein